MPPGWRGQRLGHSLFLERVVWVRMAGRRLPGGGRTGAGWQECGNRCGCSTGGGWPEQCRPRPVGAGVSGRLQGVPGWQRGWPLPRGRATFGDELDAGVQGGKAPRLQPLLGDAPLNPRPHSSAASQVCQPPPAGQGGSLGKQAGEASSVTALRQGP